MREPIDFPALSREDLLAWVAELQRQIAKLTANKKVLCAELEPRRRSRKRSGRKPGSGPFRYRESPPPEAITGPPVAVTARLAACPVCGGLPMEERVSVVDRIF